MLTLAVLLGLIMIGMGGALLVSPETFRRLLPRWVTPAGLRRISATRLAFGAVLLLAAPRTKLPVLIYVIGGISVLSGIVTPLLGIDRARRFTGWWLGKPDAFLRLWAVAALLMGALIAWSAL